MGYADRVPNRKVMSEHHRIPRVVPILGSTDCHLAVAVLARFGCARFCWWAGSGLRRLTVGFAAYHHGPDDAGDLVWPARPPPASSTCAPARPAATARCGLARL